MDFLFIHVPKLSSYYKPLDEFMFINYIPMGVFAMCDKLNKNNISARIIHLGLEYITDKSFSIVDYIKKNQIKTVGLSLHWHFQSYDVIEIARKIKEASSETSIILGGFTASLFAKEIMENYQYIDFIIAGDGEKGLVQLAGLLKNGQTGDFTQVANCLYRRNGKIIDNGITYTANTEDLTTMEYANLSYLQQYDKYRDYFKIPLFWELNSSAQENMKKNLSNATNTFPLMVGRGCTVNCSFCGGGRNAHMKMCKREKPVFLPIEKVVDTMEQALGYGYTSFLICFDPYPLDDSYYLQLFAEIRKRKLNCGIGFEAWGLPTNRLIEEFGKTFIKELSYFAISPDSFSEKIRKLNKGFYYTNEEMLKTLKTIEEQEIPILVYTTIGLPGETSTDIRNNYIFMKKLKKKYKRIFRISTVPIQLEPGSPLFENPKKYNAITERKFFRDFYEFHKTSASNPYSYLGYATQSLREAGCDIKKYDAFILNERCKRFCIIPAKLFGRFHSPAFIRFICKMSHKKWLRAGYGKVPAERKTFN